MTPVATTVVPRGFNALRPATQGLLLGLLGVMGFSLTLPMTRLALRDLDVVLVALGRSLVAAFLAAGVLRWRGKRLLPPRRHLVGLLIVAGGVIVGFPVFSALALRQVSAVHGAVVTALLPLATAAAAVWRAHERPSWGFWLAAVAGSGTVVAFLLLEHGARLQAADGWLLLAVVTCAFGYAEGGRLARELGGWRVICWALVIAAPALAGPVVWSVVAHGVHASAAAWGGFVYVSVVSMFLGFCAWYAGLARGGVARVSQVQLLQPFCSFAGAAWLLGETVTVQTLVMATVVVAMVALGRRTTVRTAVTKVVATGSENAVQAS